MVSSAITLEDDEASTRILLSPTSIFLHDAQSMIIVLLLAAAFKMEFPAGIAGNPRLLVLDLVSPC